MYQIRPLALGLIHGQSGHRLAIWSMIFSPPCRFWVFAWLLEVILRRREFSGWVIEVERTGGCSECMDLQALGNRWCKVII